MWTPDVYEIGSIARPPLASPASVSMWATSKPPSLNLDHRDCAPVGDVVRGLCGAAVPRVPQEVLGARVGARLRGTIVVATYGELG